MAIAQDNKDDSSAARSPRPRVGYIQAPINLEPQAWERIKTKPGGGGAFVRRLIRAYEENPEVARIVDAMEP